MRNVANKKIFIVSLCMDDWGGSEDLWARAIPYWQREGFSFVLYKESINAEHPEIKKLVELGVALVELKNKGLKRWARRAVKLFRIAGSSFSKKKYQWDDNHLQFRKKIRTDTPRFVIIAQAINFDGLAYARQCMELKIPYCVIVQKAVSFYWPPSGERDFMKKVLLRAKACYFVSQQNRDLTEEQFGIRLPNAKIVSNPIKIKREIIPYPPTENGLRLACVARLFIIDKGQDMLLRILAMPKWKARNLHVSFIGSGTDEEGIKDMARLLEVEKVSFPGFAENVSAVWAAHHALILPSRSEGMALSVLEAMAAGRTAIVTNAGGHKEIVQHGQTGFIAEPNEKNLDDVMEEAWQRRNEWQTIGKNAHTFIKSNITFSPEKDFSLSVMKIINE
ncbi:MAG: glycosyltransferase [Niabella sp.]